MPPPAFSDVARGLRPAAWALALGAVYFVCALLGLLLEAEPGESPVVWPASGVALLWLALSPRGRWPALALAVFAAAFAAGQVAGEGLLLGGAVAGVRTVEACLAALVLVAVSRGRIDLSGLRQVAGLLAAAGPSAALTALLGAAVLGAGAQASFFSTWQLWWVASALGMLMAGVVLLAAIGADWFGGARSGVSLSLAGLVTVVAGLTFLAPADQPLPFLAHSYPVVLLVVVIALVATPRALAVGLIGTGTMAVAGTIGGRGPFFDAPATFAGRVLELQTFLAAIIVLGLLIAVSAAGRRGATDSLRRSRDYARALVDSLSDGLVVLDEAGRITDVTPRLCEMTGYSREELIGCSEPLPFHDPDRREQEERTARSLLAADGRAEFPLSVLRRDGVRLQTLVSASTLPGLDGAGAGGVRLIRDVTAQVEAEIAHEASEARLRDFVELSPDGVLVAEQGGRIVLVNAQLERMFGYRREELIGERIEILLPERLRGVHTGHRESFAARPQVRPMGAGLDLLGCRRDGSEFPVDISISPMRTGDGPLMAAVVRDATDRGATELALREGEQRLRALVGALAEGVILIDSDGLLVDCNPAAERILGVDRELLLGTGLKDAAWETVRPDGSRLPADQLPAARALRSGEPVRGETIGVRRRDGLREWLTISAEPLRLADGPGVVASFADVTDRVESERDQAALRRLATLVAAEASPREVFDAIAHEAAAAFEAQAGGIVRFEHGGASGVVVGSWAGDPVAAVRTDAPIALDDTTATGRVAARGSASRLGDGSGDVVHRNVLIPDVRVTGSVAVPIRVGEAVWGALSVSFTERRPLSDAIEMRLTRLGDIAALAIASADARSQLATLATTDHLTGLANRRAFERHLADEVERARRLGHGLSLVVLDIDHFKRINDTHGHPVGDRVLRELARRLRTVTRGGETVARVGGEEFAWILPRSGGADALAAAERARAAIAGLSFEGVGRLTLAAGVCSLDDDRDDDLFRHADLALYWAKAAGRDRVVRYDPDLAESMTGPTPSSLSSPESDV